YIWSGIQLTQCWVLDEAAVAKKPITISTSLIATLKERIVTWKYPPEHRLTEDALCREFGVSRSPVREALRVLATNGFVRRTANGGLPVRPGKIDERGERDQVLRAVR